MDKGYIALHRILFEKPIWIESTPEQKVILIALLGMMNHAPRKWEWKGRPYLCQPGQKITSVKSIQRACGKGVTRQNIRTALKRFEKLEFLTIETTKQSTLITICNWDFYQRANHKANQEANHRLTIDQPSPNHQLTTNNNVNNDNNEEEKRGRSLSKKFQKPTAKEVSEYAKSIGFQLDGEKFINHYEANGWMCGKSKMKDWKAAVRYWKQTQKERNDERKHTSHKRDFVYAKDSAGETIRV